MVSCSMSMRVILQAMKLPQLLALSTAVRSFSSNCARPTNEHRHLSQYRFSHSGMAYIMVKTGQWITKML